MLTAGNTGIVCPQCGMRLLVLQARAVWGGLLLTILGVAAPAVLIGHLPRPLPVDKNSPWTIGVVIGLAFWMYLLNRYARRFVRLGPLESGEHAAFPLSEGQPAE